MYAKAQKQRINSLLAISARRIEALMGSHACL
jgi:hypothetical protein